MSLSRRVQYQRLDCIVWYETEIVYSMDAIVHSLR